MADFVPHEHEESPDPGVRPEELKTLFAEIRRYLDAIDVFRREGHEPGWRREPLLEAPR